MKKTRLIITLVLSALTITAAAQETASQPQANNPYVTTEKERPAVFTGFSGGMLLHLGYGFSQNPSELFRNQSLSLDNLQNLPRSGIFMGIGGQLRIHLINHIRIGGEGFVSTMPLKQIGNVRTGWGGAVADFYTTWGKVKPYIGLGLGGGSMRRTYVNENVSAGNTENPNDPTIYNASYTKTPFFYLDPQLGLSFGLTQRIDLVVRLDYMLPFSSSNRGIIRDLGDLPEQIKGWKGLMTPTGPRLYVGFMFNH